ncbi:MAG: SpoIVB peptidase [Clostridia bacterium]|nr:SpoIVB peptidase [Clostridia bacterium]
MAKRFTKGTVLFLALLVTLFSAPFSALTPDSALSASVGQWTDTHDPSLLEETVSAPPSLQTAANTRYREMKLYAGGMPFGIKFLTEGVLIVGFHDLPGIDSSKNPSRAAGLQCNDMILRINDIPLSCANDLNKTVEKSQGAPLRLLYSRNGTKQTTTLTPVYSQEEGRYTTGIYVRDSGAGIGTITFILPDTYAFAGLGHGICDSGTGKLIPMQRGSVVGVTINGVVRGLSGSPGEVKGYFSSGKTGTLIGNTDCGVYGVLAKLPEKIPCDPLPVGLREEVKEGKAYIYCALDSPTNQRYEIEISHIQRDSTSNKCFTVKVTDPALLEKTGGIIQGMSGSPIIQNGKIVGAVTHVLINDPTTGYGIFIENMLNQMGDLAG